MSCPFSNRISGLEEQQSQIMVDQKKQKRMLSNRESARRLRTRKQQHMEQLCSEVSQLSNENRQMELQVSLLNQQHLRMESENANLMTQLMELAERLHSANCLLRFMERSGKSTDIPEIHDPLLKPWQLLRLAQSIMMMPLNALGIN